MHIIGISERKIEGGSEKVFGEIMAENVPNLIQILNFF